MNRFHVVEPFKEETTKIMENEAKKLKWREYIAAMLLVIAIVVGFPAIILALTAACVAPPLPKKTKPSNALELK